MSLTVREQVKYWGIAAAVFFAILWVLGDVILPFVLGGAVAYCLDPIADRLERLGLPRVLATVVITAAAVLVFILAALLVIPALVSQAAGLVETAPALVENLRNFLIERFPALLDSESQLYQSLAVVGETLRTRGGTVLTGVLNSAAGLVNVVVLVVLVPVITFYLLMDWDRMVAEVDSLLPRDHAPTIRQLARDIDETLASFIRGQGLVMASLGTFYAIGLMLVGLQFGLVVGFTAGLISFIPYVGAIVGGVLAFGLALFQFWGEWEWIAAVVAIFFAGQFLEGNILTPKLVGSSVGLHPVWLIFALSAFGTLFGFVGMLVAVPVAASIGVVARFMVARYRESLLYKGTSGRSGD
jgi:predicted PurR-regulated permease PerM